MNRNKGRKFKGRSLWLLAVVLMILAAPGWAEPGHLESLTSKKSYSETVVALRHALNASNAKIFQEVDHRNNAVGTGVGLAPSRVFIFGNPKVGTQLMQCAPLAAVELPMRMLIRQDDDGQTRLYWVRASTLIGRYASPASAACLELAGEVDKHMAALAGKAAGDGK